MHCFSRTAHQKLSLARMSRASLYAQTQLLVQQSLWHIQVYSQNCVVYTRLRGRVHRGYRKLALHPIAIGCDPIARNIFTVMIDRLHNHARSDGPCSTPKQVPTVPYRTFRSNCGQYCNARNVCRRVRPLFCYRTAAALRTVESFSSQCQPSRSAILQRVCDT